MFRQWKSLDSSRNWLRLALKLQVLPLDSPYKFIPAEQKLILDGGFYFLSMLIF